MPRKGHKEDCQCAVCRRMAAVAVSAPRPEQVLKPTGPTFATIPVNTLFEVKRCLYHKVSEIAAINLTLEGVGSEAEPIAGDTAVIPRS